MKREYDFSKGTRGKFCRIAVDEEILAYIVDRIVQLANPNRVILFGSAAAGEMTADSDLGLLVIESRVSDTRRESSRLRAALEDVPFPIDILVMSRERFEETKDMIGSIAYPAHKYGRILYEAA